MSTPDVPAVFLKPEIPFSRPGFEEIAKVITRTATTVAEVYGIDDPAAITELAVGMTLSAAAAEGSNINYSRANTRLNTIAPNMIARYAAHERAAEQLEREL